MVKNSESYELKQWELLMGAASINIIENQLKDELNNI